MNEIPSISVDDHVQAAAAASSDHKISLRAALGCCRRWKLQEQLPVTSGKEPNTIDHHGNGLPRY
jgi:hypothetical protein